MKETNHARRDHQTKRAGPAAGFTSENQRPSERNENHVGIDGRNGKGAPPAIVRQDLLLEELARQIDAEHAAALAASRTSLRHARKVGLLLLKAKAKLPHGKFMDWVQAMCPFSHRTANNYQRVAKEWDQLRLGDDEPVTIGGAMAQLAGSNSQPAANLPGKAVGLYAAPVGRGAVRASQLRTGAQLRRRQEAGAMAVAGLAAGQDADHGPGSAGPLLAFAAACRWIHRLL